MADKDFKVKTGLDLPAPLPASEGGTGQTTLANALNALLPSQTSNTSKILGTDGTNPLWVNPGAAYQTSAPDNPVTGQLWVDSDETGDSLDPYIIRRKTITATAGQTVFTTDVVFTDGYEQIYYNGVLLVRTTDYTTNGGTNTVTLLQGASAGDTVEIISSTPINLVNTLAGNSANTITAQTASSIPLTIEGASSQSVNFFQIKNSVGEPRLDLSASSMFSIRGYETDPSGIEINRYGANGPVAALGLRAAGGTIASPSVIPAGSRIGLISSNAHDGTNYLNTARITFAVDGTVSTGSVPSMIQFNTTPVGGSHTERMRITSAGNVYIGTTDASAYGAKLAIANVGQASLFMWNSGQGSGHIGFPASGSTMRIVNTYADGLIANGKGIDINANGNVGVGWNPDNNWHLSVNSTNTNMAGAFLSTTSANSLAGLFEATKSDYSNVILKLGANRSANSAYTFIQALSGIYTDAEFNLRGDGQAYADGSWNSGGADYAEYFEWLDGNPNNEDRRGHAVSLINDKIKISEEGDVSVGVISGNPSVVGDSAWNKWNGKYLADRFGSYLKDENGERILNPDYDPETEYVSREDRPEWAIVGLMGKLRLRKGQVTGAGWIKMKDIDEDTEEWLVK